jgi:CheY-like chemotaxis protein
MGLEVLKWVRQRPEFATIVVLVLTASANPLDINTAYQLGANAYLVKPSSLEKLKVLARAIRDFWLAQNQSVPLRVGKPEADG